jgi:hypothetical protein
MNGLVRPCKITLKQRSSLNVLCRPVALLHKAVGKRTFPFPGHIYLMVFVKGMPSAVYLFMMALRTWTSATCRSKSRAMRRCPSSFMQCIHCPAGLCKA